MKVIAYVLILVSCLCIPRTSSLDTFSKSKKQYLKSLDSLKTEKYIITSVLHDPFLKLKENEDTTGNEGFEGYIKDLTDLLANKVGFDYELRLVKDSSYGRQNSDGEWNGMIGELIRKEADIAIAPLTITYHRQNVVDFTIPFITTGISLMIKRPSLVQEETFDFLFPFTRELWLSIAFSCVGVTIVFFIVNKFSSYDVKRREDFSKQLSEKGTLSTLKAILKQQNETRKGSLSKKIVVFVFWFFIFILIASYTANLSAFLRAKRTYTSIQNVQELSSQSDIQYGLIIGGSTQSFFKDSNSPVYLKMWDFMKSKKDVFVSSSKEGIEKVRKANGKYVFLLEGVVNDYLTGQSPCDTVRLGPNLNSVGYGIAVAKGHPLRDRLNAALLMLGSDGSLATVQNKWLYDKSPQCEDKRLFNEGPEPITLCSVSGLFYILIIGLIFSLLVAISECCFRSKQENTE